MTIRSYSELVTMDDFMDRFKYLQIYGSVGESTFGFDRYLNQRFYKDPEWLKVRDYVIVRDAGCDLGILDREIVGRVLVHHMNPISKEDILNRTKFLLDPEYLISTSSMTHEAIHYGDENLLLKEPVVRTANDTVPWRHI